MVLQLLRYRPVTFIFAMPAANVKLGANGGKLECG